MICEKYQKSYQNFYDFETHVARWDPDGFQIDILKAYTTCGKTMMSPQIFKFCDDESIFSPKFKITLVDGIFSCPYCNVSILQDPVQNNSEKIEQMRDNLIIKLAEKCL